MVECGREGVGVGDWVESGEGEERKGEGGAERGGGKIFRVGKGRKLSKRFGAILALFFCSEPSEPAVRQPDVLV